MGTAYVAGAGNTRFGRLEGQGPLDLMADAAQRALADARLERRDIDGVLCGYATTLPHLMLSSLFCERFSLEPAYAHGVQLGGDLRPQRSDRGRQTARLIIERGCRPRGGHPRSGSVTVLTPATFGRKGSPTARVGA